MYRSVCLYVKAKIFFVKNKRERSTCTYIHVYVWGYVSVLVCLSPLIYWSFNLTVGVLTYLSVSDFFFHMRCIHVICVCLYAASLFFLTKKFWVLILFEWIKIRYFKFMWVDFMSGQLKFKCKDM